MLVHKLLYLFSKYKDTIALSFFFFGAPIIYFFRDGLGLAPGNTYFTVAFMICPLFLIFLQKDFRLFYKPNTIAYTLSLTFIFQCMVYLSMYYNVYFNRSFVINEYFVICVILLLYTALLLTSLKSLENTFLYFAIIFGIIGSMGLVYAIISNPFYIIGQRASISFNPKDTESTGNPHVFARCAFLGIMACIILLKYNKTRKRFLILITCLTILCAILLLTQAMSALLATILAVSTFALFNRKYVYKSAKGWLASWYFWIIILTGLIAITRFINKNKEVFETVYNMISLRVEKLLSTFIGGGKEDAKGITIIDESANERVKTVQLVFAKLIENLENGNYLKVLFGNGYLDVYVDVPMLESFNSFGLVGFLLFVGLFLVLLKACVREFINPKTQVTEFIAYGFIYILVINITNGLAVEYTRWGYYALVSRFILFYKEDSKSA